MQVLVRDNNVDQALRALKKKMQREGVFREMSQGVGGTCAISINGGRTVRDVVGQLHREYGSQK